MIASLISLNNGSYIVGNKVVYISGNSEEKVMRKWKCDFGDSNQIERHDSKVDLLTALEILRSKPLER